MCASRFVDNVYERVKRGKERERRSKEEKPKAGLDTQRNKKKVLLVEKLSASVLLSLHYIRERSGIGWGEDVVGETKTRRVCARGDGIESAKTAKMQGSPESNRKQKETRAK